MWGKWPHASSQRTVARAKPSAAARRRHQPRAPAWPPAEAGYAAREQRQPLDARGVRERVGHRDPRAERVADERDLGDADRVEEGVERAREVRERVPGGRLAG